MPIRKVTDPSVLQQLNAGGPAISNGLYPGQVESQQQTIARNAAELPYVAPKARADASKAGAEAAIAAAQAPFARDIALAGRDKAKYDAQKAQIEASGNGPKLDPSQRAKAIQQFNYAQQLNDVVDHLNQLYIKGPGATSGLEGLKDFLPTPDNTNFDTTANAARGIVGQALNFTGGQLNTPQEAAKAVGPFLPQSSDYDTTILQKINTLKEMAKNGQENAIQTLGGVPDANGNVHPITPSNALPPITGPGQDMATTATGKTRDVVDPVLKATGQRVGTMISAGAPDAQILDFLQKSGVNPADTSVSQALKFRQTPEFKRWQRANPGKSYPLGPNFYTKQVPMTDARRILNRTAASGIGGAALAAPVAAADAISGGRLDNLVADPAAAQTGMALLRGNHPISSFAGDVAGQASLEALAGTVPGAQALMATKMGRRGADLLYGAYSGSGNDEQNPGLGAVGGGALGLGGGMLGRGLQRTIGGASRGVTNQSLQYLDNLGVPLTIGQIGRGSKSTLGHIVGGVEERIRGLPGFDAVIGGARRRGDIGFNQAAFKEAGGTGATGAAGLDEVARLRDNAYGFLNGTDIPLDAQFAGSQAGVRAAVPALPAYGNEVASALNAIDNTAANGTLSGRDWQSALRSARSDRSSIKGQPFADKAGQALSDIENNLQGLAARQGPSGTLADLSSANNLHAKVETLARALDNGAAQTDELFSPKGLDNAARNARNFGGRTASLTGNRPFYTLTSAGKEVMPDLTPDSGTAGRLALIPLLGGLGGGAIGTATGGDEKVKSGEMGAGYGALLALAAAGPYSKAGQKIIQKALLADRPRAMMTLGDLIINANPKLASRVGASSLRDFFYQPELYSQ